jgi:hypothetical protein
VAKRAYPDHGKNRARRNVPARQEPSKERTVEVGDLDLHHYALRIDGPLLRKQRHLLLKLVDFAHRNTPNISMAKGDADLLEGLVALLDEIADQAHDQYGIDCLLDSQPEEPSDGRS